MNKSELEAIVSDMTGLYTPEQKTKAQAALTDYEAPKSGDEFATLTGSQPICLGSSYETRHFQITVESGYAAELLRTRTMSQAANQACNDKLVGGLRAKYDASEDETFQKRFPKDCYKVLSIEESDKYLAVPGQRRSRWEKV